MHELITEFNDQQQEMLNFLERLVEIETPSKDKKAVDQLTRFLQEEFSELEFHTKLLTEEEYGDHLLVEGPSAFANRDTKDEDDYILLLSHMDTVWDIGEISKRPFQVKGQFAYGPGICDMKGGIMQLYYALKTVNHRQSNLSSIKCLFTSDEELGSPTGKQVIEEYCKQAKVVLVLEPPIGKHGAIKTFRKGVGVFQLQVTGKSSHAGTAPKEGVSAVEELARQILELHSLTDLERGTNVNVGVISGGSRSNVIAGSAEAEIDVRVSEQDEGERVANSIKSLTPKLKGSDIKVTGGLNRLPMNKTEKTKRLFTAAQDLAKNLGFDLEEGSTGGASDGNFTAALGVPTLDGLGAVGEGIHSVDEYINITHLPYRNALLTRLLETL